MNFADHDMWTEIPNRFVLQNRNLNFVWTNDTFLFLNQKSWLGSRCSLLEQDQNYSAKESRAQTFANYVRRKSSLSFAYIWWLTTKALQLRYKSQDTERNIFNLAFVSNIINDNVSKFLLKRVKKSVIRVYDKFKKAYINKYQFLSILFQLVPASTRPA